MERKRIIVVTPEEAKYLARLFNVSSVTVWAALKYRKSNLIHKKIRKAAIERGGLQMVLTPEFEAIYITNRQDADKEMNRYMVQPFENGATMEGCFKTGLVVVRDKRGEVKGEWNNPKMSEIKAIQEMAKSL
ncbi:hypothetical protein D1647_19130 [Alistipes sp. Z76]|nr:hypothetical protein [Alistipes sp. Z76]NCE70278.1 hypothetical protein [Muribaculaceae bacterium M3]